MLLGAMRIAALLPFCLAVPLTAQETPLRLAIAGLVHGHVTGFLKGGVERKDVAIVGVFDPDRSLHEKYGKRFGLAAPLFYTDLGAMLDAVKPEAVAAFTDTFDHVKVVEEASRRGITVMMEKPLAVSVEHARAIERAAAKGKIQVIVNYETTWYRSHGELWRFFKEQKAGGAIRKMVAMDGHMGPREIGVPPEFFEWLTDPVRNGAGALYDFGCYGANLMTWLMDHQRPVSVMAMTARNKPAIYPKVDDEATILVEYPGAQGIIQASWNWPYNRKDFEVYGAGAYAHAIGGNTVRRRLDAKAAEETVTPQDLPAEERDPLTYLRAVARGRNPARTLSSLENNVIVTEILEAARESARTGKRVTLRR